MTRRLAFALLLGWAPAVAAQDQPPRERNNSVYFELGGTGCFSTLNYERMVSSKINVRAGVGLIPGDFQPGGYDLTIGGADLGSVPAVVVASNVVFGKRRHQFTTGIAVNFQWNRVDPFEPQEAVYFGGEVGYRLRATSGFLLKATLGVMGGTEAIWIAPGVSLGWSF